MSGHHYSGPVDRSFEHAVDDRIPMVLVYNVHKRSCRISIINSRIPLEDDRGVTDSPLLCRAFSKSASGPS